MASRVLVVITVLLTFAAEASYGSIQKCQMTSLTTGWIIIECNGQKDGKELSEMFSQRVVSNISRLVLSLTELPPHQNMLSFEQFANLTHLRIQAEDVSTILSNMTGLNALKSLNLSSNRIEELPDISNLEKLEELELSNNSLSQIDFGFIPSTIMSINLNSNNIAMYANVTLPESLISLDLSNNHMTDVQPILSETLLRLNLSGNEISDLSFVLSLVTVEDLDLSKNHITELEDDTFSTLSSLIRLDLCKNYLKFLKEKSFSGLTRLQIIDLSHNILQSITPGTFQYLSNLLWLNLADNKNLGNLDAVEDSSILLGAGQKLQTVDASRTNLTKVPNTLTRSIRNLYLSCNRISTIRCGDLDSFLLLQFLDLTSNNISIIEDDALGRLELLYYLLLAENYLTFIPHSLPDNLLVLDMDHNRIQNLSASDFFGLSKLMTLRLAWNHIKVIQDSAFGQLSSLQNLDLSGNPIKMLSGSTFVGPRRLVDLSLSSLTSIVPTNDTLSFPVPESSHLQVLNLENSPALVNQLMNDIAALSMFKHIKVLNLAFTNTQSLRSDLVNFFPRLEVLDLRGNKFNCTNVTWLSNWLRHLREDPSDDIKLQSLDENRSSIYRKTDFEVAQAISAYTNRLETVPADEGPKCASPDHLVGVSLYEVRGPTSITSTEATTRQQPRYGRPNINIRKMHDHEFYQNDFPPPVSEHKVESSTVINKFSVGDKRQTKRSNTTDSVSTSSISLQTNKTFLDKNITNPSDDNRSDIANISNILNILRHDTIKAEYLRSENKLNSSEFNVLENKTDKENRFSKKDKTNDISTKQTNNVKDVVSIYSPLDVTLHEANNDKRNGDPKPGDDNTLSVSSPQKISIAEDMDIAKDILDDDAEDPEEERYTHHPGLLIFIVAAGILGVTAVVMRASHRRQSRRGYAQQQDIEVRSLDLSAQELW